MLKNIAIIVLVVVAVLETLALYGLSSPPAPAPLVKQLAYSDFMHEVDAGQVSSVSIQGNGLTGSTRDSQRFRTYLPDDPTLVPHLVNANVRVVVLSTTEPASALSYFLSWVPIFLVTGVLVWYLSRISRAISGMSVTLRTLSRPAPHDQL